MGSLAFPHGGKTDLGGVQKSDGEVISQHRRCEKSSQTKDVQSGQQLLGRERFVFHGWAGHKLSMILT